MLAIYLILSTGFSVWYTFRWYAKFDDARNDGIGALAIALFFATTFGYLFAPFMLLHLLFEEYKIGGKS